jgi:hypothetical protein
MKTVWGFNFYQLHLLIWLTFLCAYSFIGLKEHFDTEPSVTNATFFTTMVHTTIGFGDVQPKTPLARWLVTVHAAIVLVLMSWLMTT